MPRDTTPAKDDDKRPLPPGIYEHLVTRGIAERVGDTPSARVSKRPLDPADAHVVLARHVGELAHRALYSVRGDDAAAVERQVQMANAIAGAIVDLAPASVPADEVVSDTRDLLLAIASSEGGPGRPHFPDRPATDLSASALLVNGQGQPRIGFEVVKEFASADSVDLLCAFITWHGLRLLESAVGALIARGARMRVITTTYVGATERRALDRLVSLGAEVKVSYETRTTRLHAKSWLFRRASGFSTAYVGSSNMSKAALVDGLEWNVRLSNVEQPHLLATFADTYEDYWADPSFESYLPERDGERLAQALAAEHGGPTDLPLELTTLDVRPFGYQQEILEALAVERQVHDRWRNLIVMATGTGKTVVAALDYKRLREAAAADSLLFVAHREEILRQSLSTFRHVLRRGDFGESFVGGGRPAHWRHVFASIQSIAQTDLADLPPDHFDVVIIDEFHHAQASTYRRLLDHVRPRVLVGLTATPERADGLDITDWFGGRTAVELRLWEALEQGYLAPFQYFGIHDDVALDALTWRRGRGYDVGDISNLYTGNDARCRLVLQTIANKIADPGRMRALGFCVSIDHANYMARRFSEAGIPSRAITSRTADPERRAALRALDEREVNALFTVDLFNEGVDLPAVDTVLFLRPTESATVFLQQLGRGLRLANDKSCLTVLDFIGAQHKEFRFDLRYRALTGATRRGLERDVAQGFLRLPAGCHIELDRVASQIVLDNLRRSLTVPRRELVAELKRVGDVSLAAFLQETGIDLEDVYRQANCGWTSIRRDAGFARSFATDDDAKIGRAFARMLHADDPERLSYIRKAVVDLRWTDIVADPRQRRLAAMLHFAIWGSNEPLTGAEDGLRRLITNEARRSELLELCDVLRSRIARLTPVVAAESGVPLRVHARYSRDEALAAFGVENPGIVRQGVKWVAGEAADVFFVTLRKSETHFSPTTMYADFAISSTLFQWESQNTTSEGSPTGRRYIHHGAQGSSVHLFLRETKEADGALGTPPYLYAGPMTYVEHEGERPMRIRWHLDHALPADVFHAARVAAG